jgi:hypothetical protein
MPFLSVFADRADGSNPTAPVIRKVRTKYELFLFAQVAVGIEPTTCGASWVASERGGVQHPTAPVIKKALEIDDFKAFLRIVITYRQQSCMMTLNSEAVSGVFSI